MHLFMKGADGGRTGADDGEGRDDEEESESESENGILCTFSIYIRRPNIGFFSLCNSQGTDYIRHLLFALQTDYGR